MGSKISPKKEILAKRGQEDVGVELDWSPTHFRTHKCLDNLWQQQTPAGVSNHSRTQRSLQNPQRSQHGEVCAFVCATGAQTADLRGPALDLLLHGLA